MKIKLFLLLFCSFTAICQKPKLEIVIDSLNYKDNPNERIFTLKYHLTNLTSEKISFFFNPNRIFPNSAASMKYSPYYRIFENNKMENFPVKFNSNRSTDSKKDKHLEFLLNYKKYVDSVYVEYQKKGGKNDDKYWVAKKTELLDNILTMNPNETKFYSFDFYWDKTTYYVSDNIEYLIEKTDNFEMDLTINLMKKDFKEWLTPDEFSKIEKDKNFIENVFTSNKVKLNFF